MFDSSIEWVLLNTICLPRPILLNIPLQIIWSLQCFLPLSLHHATPLSYDHTLLFYEVSKALYIPLKLQKIMPLVRVIFIIARKYKDIHVRVRKKKKISNFRFMENQQKWKIQSVWNCNID